VRVQLGLKCSLYLVMKRRSRKTDQQLRTLQAASSSAELAVTTDPVAAAAGSGRQRRFTAKQLKIQPWNNAFDDSNIHQKRVQCRTLRYRRCCQF